MAILAYDFILLKPMTSLTFLLKHFLIIPWMYVFYVHMLFLDIHLALRYGWFVKFFDTGQIKYANSLILAAFLFI